MDYTCNQHTRPGCGSHGDEWRFQGQLGLMAAALKLLSASILGEESNVASPLLPVFYVLMSFCGTRTMLNLHLRDAYCAAIGTLIVCGLKLQ